MSKLLTAWQEYQKYKKLTPAGKRIVIFSESYQDWHHFEPLVTGLTAELNQEICYVASDPSDPGLATGHPLIHAFYIPEGIIQIIFFQFLDAELMILTMMDLNNYELKRSIHPVHGMHQLTGKDSNSKCQHPGSKTNPGTHVDPVADGAHNTKLSGISDGSEQHRPHKPKNTRDYSRRPKRLSDVYGNH